MKTRLDRFKEKYEVDESTGCWIWNGATQSKGYSQFWDGEGSVGGHVWSHLHFIGPIPDGMIVNHKCHDWADPPCEEVMCIHRRCVNPDHIEAVPPRENIMSKGSRSPSKVNSEKTHCIHGHELSGRNLMVKNGKRQCRECQYAAQRRWQARNKKPEASPSVT